MIFQREGCKPRSNPSAKQLALELKRAKSSFASLAAENGSFVQVAGGPGLFVIEYRDSSGQHFRGFQDAPVASHPDGTLLQTSAGSISMARSDWFLIGQVLEAFLSFLNSAPWPSNFHWRELNGRFEKIAG
jgi:hypothetical protein